jgi:hypothetical protein
VSERRLAFYRRLVETLRWMRLVVGACVLGTVAFALLGWGLAARQAASAEARLPRERGQCQTLRQVVAQAQSRSRGALPAGAETGDVLTPEVVAELKRAADRLGNQVTSVRQMVPAGSAEGASGAPVEMDMTLLGSFDSIFAFLRHLDGQPLPLTVRALDLRPVADGHSGLTVQLKVGLASPPGKG